MALAGNLVVNVLADTKKFKNGMRDVEKTAKGTMQRIGKLTSLVRRFWGEIAFAVMAMNKIVRVFKDVTRAAFDDEKATALLNSTLRATGIWTEELSQQLQDYASEMQLVTKFSDEQVKSAAGILATFTQIGTEAYPEVIERAMDMSTIFGVDLNQAIIQLGKSINDPRMAEGLRRIGITMSQSQVDMIDNFLEMGDVWSAQRVILDELELELGGAAIAYGKTLPGQVDILKTRFDELKEKIGYAITENLPDMIEAGTKFAEWADKVALTEENINKVQATIQALIGVVVVGFQMWIERIRTFVTAVKIVMDTIHQFGLALDIVFNPKNWGKGKIKEQLKDIEWTADELFKGIIDGWGNVADEIKEKMQKVRNAWTGANEKIQEEVKETEKVMVEMPDEFGFTLEDWEAYEKAITEFDQAMVLSGKVALQYRESLLATKRGTALLNEETIEQTDSMEKIIDLMAKMSIMEYDYGVAVEEVTEKVEKLTWAEEQLKDMEFNLSEMIYNSAVPAFEAFGAATGTLGTMMKDFIKTAVANLFKSLGAYLAQMALLFILPPPQFAKAALAAAGSIAAYAAASEIANLQMGGLVEQMQGMQMGGFGDIVPAMLEPGEMVIPKETVQREQPAIQEAIGGESGGQQIQIFLDGRELSNFVTKNIRNKKILVDARAVT